MHDQTTGVRERRRWFLTPRGLDCHGSLIRLRTEKELKYWAEQNVDPDKIRCNGCRADRDKNHWSPDCRILQCCVYDRKLEFCAMCPDFPCRILEDWAAQHEHHMRGVEELKQMKKIGMERWLKDKVENG